MFPPCWGSGSPCLEHCPGAQLGPRASRDPCHPHPISRARPLEHAPLAQAARGPKHSHTARPGEALWARHLPILWPGPRAGGPGGRGGAGGTAGPRAGPAPPEAAARGSGTGTGRAGAVEGPTDRWTDRWGDDRQREDTWTNGRTDRERRMEEGGGGAGEPVDPLGGQVQPPLAATVVGGTALGWGLTSFKRSMSLR